VITVCEQDVGQTPVIVMCWPGDKRFCNDASPLEPRGLCTKQQACRLLPKAGSSRPKFQTEQAECCGHLQGLSGQVLPVLLPSADFTDPQIQ
jgi:hypothetical protein